jgi:hypothetical protein
MMPRASILLALCALLPAADLHFPAGSVIDLTAPPYSAVPDDGRDDTAALQRAISDHVGTGHNTGYGAGRFLYLPAGTYEISDTLQARNREGVWRGMLTIQGAGRGRTVLRLADRATGFHDPAKPKAMLMTGSQADPADAADGGGNKAFRNYIFDLTIDAGKGNPGAIGIEWAVNFPAASATSTCGDGAAGIALRRRIPGPA